MYVLARYIVKRSLFTVRHSLVGTTLNMYNTRGSVCPIKSGVFPLGNCDVENHIPNMGVRTPPLFIYQGRAKLGQSVRLLVTRVQ